MDRSVLQSGALEVVRDSHKDTVIGDHAGKESFVGGIIILLTSEPVIDPFMTNENAPLCGTDLKGSYIRLGNIDR